MRRSLTFTLPLVALLCACQPGKDANLGDAQRFYAEGQWADARIELMNLLKVEPDNIAALELMARIQVASGDGVGAAATLARIGDKNATKERADLQAEADMLRGKCRDLRDRKPDKDAAMSATLRRVRALCAHDGGDAAAAASEIAAGLADHPGDTGLQVAAARLAMLRGDLAEADRLIAAARKKDNEKFEVEMVAGAIQQRRANITAALGHYAAAEKLNPLNSGPLSAQAELLAAAKDVNALTAVVERLRRMSPQSSATAIATARLELLRGDPRAAQQQLLAARQLAGDRPSIQLLASQIAVAQGNHDIAIAELSRYLGSGARDEVAAMALADAMAAAGEPDRAVETLKPFAAQPDPSRSLLAALSRHAKAAGQSDAAAYAARAVGASPRRTANLLIQAEQALAAKDWKGAIIAYDALIEREGIKPNAMILNNLGWAHFQNGNADKAVTLLDAALKQAPENASVLDSLGWVLWSSGKDRAAARRHLAKAHRLAPENATIKAHWEAANR
ncbi:MAG: tetratricopeptide repeat protein [Sphingopyxis sp.]|uniref:tetratricopeptide repeat protein n=1 Tax=Sphingopyxis sp. TaxID=1908224 RepID=UPI002ABA6CAB|nr:tetratricopeptide repeat protein [Sphingopyxis sp.]MDZ3830361.1 tetratricopeptide repeat protein [Sphingopyxis sp.]